MDDKELATDMTMDSCIRDGILKDILIEERARMREHLIGGLTEEEKEELHAWEKECECEEGRKEGQDTIIKMNEYLIEQGRYDDLKHATEDSEFREAILREIKDAEMN